MHCFSQQNCVEFLFLDLHRPCCPPPPPPPLRLSSHTIFHQHFVTHHLSRTSLSHTHSFVTHHLSHTIFHQHFVTHHNTPSLSHTIFHTIFHMSKKCTLLCREAHVEVYMLKTPRVRTTFGRSAIVLCGRQIETEASKPDAELLERSTLEDWNR